MGGLCSLFLSLFFPHWICPRCPLQREGKGQNGPFSLELELSQDSLKLSEQAADCASFGLPSSWPLDTPVLSRSGCSSQQGGSASCCLATLPSALTFRYFPPEIFIVGSPPHLQRVLLGRSSSASQPALPPEVATSGSCTREHCHALTCNTHRSGGSRAFPRSCLHSASEELTSPPTGFPAFWILLFTLSPPVQGM